MKKRLMTREGWWEAWILEDERRRKVWQGDGCSEERKMVEGRI